MSLKITTTSPVLTVKETQSNHWFIKKHFNTIITATQLVADFFTVMLGFMGSYYIYTGPLKGDLPQTFFEYSLFSGLCGVFYLLLLDQQSLYRREISLLNIKELRGIFRVGVYAALGVLSVLFYIRSTSFSRITYTMALVSTPVLLYFQRQLFYKIHVLFHERGWSQRRILIYGAGVIGQHLAKRLFQSPALGLYPIGFLDDDVAKHGLNINWRGPGPKEGLKILGNQDWLDQAALLSVEQVLIALPSAKFERNQQLVEKCVALGLNYAIVPNAFEQFIQHVETFEIAGIPIMRRKKTKANFLYHIAKRLIDFCLSLFFIIILAPLALFIAAAIKFTSPGTILFKHKRVGLRGKLFTMYKFRSMFSDAPQYARTPSHAEDQRITKIGRWLRRTSLDELPQLFNVLRGDMSLVGPRPEMEFIVQQYSALERQRLEAKPGITGVWQISAFRGEPIHANIEYDLFYIENRSILLDLAIIVKTILSVILGVGAI